MTKWISMGVLTAFLFSCVACQKDDSRNRRGSRRMSKRVAHVEQVVDSDNFESSAAVK